MNHISNFNQIIQVWGLIGQAKMDKKINNPSFIYSGMCIPWSLSQICAALFFILFYQVYSIRHYLAPSSTK
jgi:hypothetical protein